MWDVKDGKGVRKLRDDQDGKCVHGCEMIKIEKACENLHLVVAGNIYTLLYPEMAIYIRTLLQSEIAQGLRTPLHP